MVSSGGMLVKTETTIFVPYVGEASIRFVKALFRLCLNQFNARLIPLYCTNAVEWDSIFNEKSATPLPLCSNVVYKLLVRVIQT